MSHTTHRVAPAWHAGSTSAEWLSDPDRWLPTSPLDVMGRRMSLSCPVVNNEPELLPQVIDAVAAGLRLFGDFDAPARQEIQDVTTDLLTAQRERPDDVPDRGSAVTVSAARYDPFLGTGPSATRFVVGICDVPRKTGDLTCSTVPAPLLTASPLAGTPLVASLPPMPAVDGRSVDDVLLVEENGRCREFTGGALVWRDGIRWLTVGPASRPTLNPLIQRAVGVGSDGRGLDRCDLGADDALSLTGPIWRVGADGRIDTVALRSGADRNDDGSTDELKTILGIV